MNKSLEFQYDPAPQRSLEWLDRKRGKIGASRLGDWLSVSKAKKTEGKPLKARLDYEKELMFERQFGVSFQMYVTDAMQEGIDYEDFARKQFTIAMPHLVAEEVGCWYNDFITISPDRLLFPIGSNTTDFDNAVAVLEIKIVKDNTFTDILMNGVPDKHMKQIQGQLWATGMKCAFYCALNFNTKRFVIITVERDEELIDYMKESVQEQLVVEPFKLDTVHEIQGEIPDWSNQEMNAVTGAKIDHSDSATDDQGW